MITTTESRRCVDCDKVFDTLKGVFPRDQWAGIEDEKRPRCTACLAWRKRLRDNIVALSDSDLVGEFARLAGRVALAGSGFVIMTYSTSEGYELRTTKEELLRRLSLRPKEKT